MAIGPVVLNGTISRVQDISTMKQNEDNKGMVQQSHMQQKATQEIDHRLNHVRNADETMYHQKGFDAKEKGGNQYSGDGGKQRKNKQKAEGKVIPKGPSRSFDIKI